MSSIEARTTFKFRILYIEDTQTDQLILKHLLDKEMKDNYELTTVTTGEEGLSKIEKVQFDLILLDYRLPDMTGLEFLDRLQETPNITPIIFVTGKGDQRIAVEAMKRGVRDYFVKDEIGSGNLMDSMRDIISESILPKTVDTKTAIYLSQLFSKSNTIEIETSGVFRTSPEGDIADKMLLSALDAMVEAGLLEARSLRSIATCPSCEALITTYHLKCQNCESKLLTKGDVIEHLECGNINFRERYDNGKSELVCPKCRKKLIAIGVDYRRVGNWFKCQNEHFFGLPALTFLCYECHEEFGLEKAKLDVIKKYVLTEKGSRSMRLTGLSQENGGESSQKKTSYKNPVRKSVESRSLT